MQRAKSPPIKLRRFPKALADDVLAALGACRNLGLEGDRLEYYLTIFREKEQGLTTAQRIAIWGVNSPSSRKSHDYIKHYPFHPEIRIALRDLDRAFEKLHHYRNGGANAYLAQGVERALKSLYAQQNRLDALGLLMLEIMEGHRSISARDMWQELKKHKGFGVIESVTDEQIEWSKKNNNIKDETIHTIASRMSRLRKKYDLR